MSNPEARERAYLTLVEGWIRDNRGIIFTDGSVDDLCDRIAALQRPERYCPGCNKSLTELCEVGCGHDDCPFPRALGEQPLVAEQREKS